MLSEKLLFSKKINGKKVTMSVDVNGNYWVRQSGDRTYRYDSLSEANDKLDLLSR